jgi:hypothetical protein
MPKNTACPGLPWVSDPITDQEMAFAHLVLSGTMNDREAAEAVGLNPDTAAYTKSKPRVRAYMLEHRAAVSEKLVDQEADQSRRAVEGLRKLNLGRDQILARLWELANLSSEATRGSIAGQVKALAMIVAIEGLVPNSRLSPTRNQPTAPPAKPQTHTSEWLRKQHQPAGEPGDVVAGAKVQAAAARSPEPGPPPQTAPKLANNASFPNHDRNNSSVINPFVIPAKMSCVPEATGSIFDVALNAINSANSFRLPFSRG